MIDAKTAANLCGIAYLPPWKATVAAEALGLDHVWFLTKGGTQVLLGVLNETAGCGVKLKGNETTVVCFRGTAVDPIQVTWRDVLKFRAVRTIAASAIDFKYDVLARREPWQGPGEVHRGFRAALENVSLDIHEYIGNRRSSRVDVIGHSLGGALSHLYAGIIAFQLGALSQVNVTTFGCPHVGDAEACRHIEYNCGRIHNWTYCSDIVPRLLSVVPGYHRPGDTQYVDRNGKLLYHATRLRKFWDRSVHRGGAFVRAGGVLHPLAAIPAAFAQEVSHHRMAGWDGREALEQRVVDCPRDLIAMRGPSA